MVIDFQSDIQNPYFKFQITQCHLTFIILSLFSKIFSTDNFYFANGVENVFTCCGAIDDFRKKIETGNNLFNHSKY